MGGAQVIDVRENPERYRHGAIECVDAIRAALTEEEFRGYCKGCAIKYLWRERHKGHNADLGKAADYIDYLLEGDGLRGSATTRCCRGIGGATSCTE